MKKLKTGLIFTITILFISIISGLEAKAKDPTIKVTPKTAFIQVGKSKKFIVTKSGKISKNVNWFVNYIAGGDATSGTIDAKGVYTAPATLPDGDNPVSIEIKAVSIDNPLISGKADAEVYSSPAILSIKISPSQASVVKGSKKTFTVIMKIKGTVDKTVKWFINDIEGGDDTVGKIVSKGKTSGVYTAPVDIPADPAVTIKAVSIFDDKKSATADVTIVKEQVKLIAQGIGPVIDFGEVTINQPITTPIRRIFTIKTNTGESVGWQASRIPTWLKVTPITGGTGDQVTLEVYDTSHLNIGLTQDTVNFVSGNAGVKALSIPVFINARSGF